MLQSAQWKIDPIKTIPGHYRINDPLGITFYFVQRPTLYIPETKAPTLKTTEGHTQVYPKKGGNLFIYFFWGGVLTK